MKQKLWKQYAQGAARAEKRRNGHIRLSVGRDIVRIAKTQADFDRQMYEALLKPSPAELYGRSRWDGLIDWNPTVYSAKEYNKLLSAARQMHFELIAFGHPPLAEMVDRFGNENGR
jgi:hypothetical protein